jgi:hypothetical protein
VIPPDPDGIELEMMIVRVCGETIGRIVAEKAASGGVPKTDDEWGPIIADTLPLIVSRLHARDYVQPDGARIMGLSTAMKMVFRSVRCEGVELSMEMFNSRPGSEKYAVFLMGLQENFKGFLGDVLSTFLPTKTEK